MLKSDENCNPYYLKTINPPINNPMYNKIWTTTAQYSAGIPAKHIRRSATSVPASASAAMVSSSSPRPSPDDWALSLSASLMEFRCLILLLSLVIRAGMAKNVAKTLVQSGLLSTRIPPASEQIISVN